MTDTLTNTPHLDAIDLRLSHERERLRTAKTARDRAFREHNVRQIEREREQEIAFLASKGIVFPTLDEILSDDELFAALNEAE